MQAEDIPSLLRNAAGVIEQLSSDVLRSQRTGQLPAVFAVILPHDGMAEVVSVWTSLQAAREEAERMRSSHPAAAGTYIAEWPADVSDGARSGARHVD